MPTTIGERLAHQSGGVFYLRIEDTDAKREVEGAAEGLIRTLEHYGIHFDEGAVIGEDGKICDRGIYGPYRQSQRGPIYHVYAKQLVALGKAYPVFTTKEELEAMNAVDKKAEIKAKDWHEDQTAQREAMLRAREITIEEVEKNLAEGNPFVLRILADGDPEKKVPFTDLIKGKLEIPENDEDFVLLKSDGIPTYHFAHAVDDHLMGTTHVIRGEEWLPSLAKHIMLFRYLGFRMPKYMHIAQIMRLDENGNKKKLSKRDMGANMDDYSRMGYAPACVCEYIMTLLNSNYEEWHMQNPDKPYTDFPFNIKKMSNSGCLFDFDKLNDVSKNVISRMSAEEVTALVTAWAKEYDPAFGEQLAKPYMGFFFDPAQTDAYPEQFSSEDIKAALIGFLGGYDPADEMNAWFDKIKAVAREIGYADDMKAYKADPSAFRGSIADVSMFLRVAVTGKLNAPDLYTVMQILGKDETVRRVQSMIDRL